MRTIVGFVATIFIALVAYIVVQPQKDIPQKATHIAKPKATNPHKSEDEVVFQTTKSVETPQEKSKDIEKRVDAMHPPREQKSKKVDNKLVKKEATDTNASSSKLLSNTQPTSDTPLSDKEWEDIEKQMIASGQISQKDDLHASTKNLGYDPSELAEDVQYSAKPTSNAPLSDKEWEDVEKQMIKSGQIRQEDDLRATTKNLGYDPSEIANGI